MKRALLLPILVLVALAGCGDRAAEVPKPYRINEKMEEAGRENAGETLHIGVMPKLVGIDYFNATEQGAREAAKELGVELEYDGPVTNDVAAQAQLIETWIAKGFDAIAIAPNDPDAIATVLERARKRGIPVVAWDADAREAARDFFVNQATYDAIAKTMIDTLVDAIGPEGKFLFLTGSLTAANQNIWMEEMEKYRAATYPQLTNLSATPLVSQEDQALATQVTADAMKAYPEMTGMLAITSVALPGAAEAVRKAGAADKLFLSGLSTPNTMKQYVKDGTVKRFVLWNPVDLGYLTVYAAVALAKGELKPGDTTLEAGRLGTVEVAEDNVLLGAPLVFDAANIDDFNF